MLMQQLKSCKTCDFWLQLLKGHFLANDLSFLEGSFFPVQCNLLHFYLHPLLAPTSLALSSYKDNMQKLSWTPARERFILFRLLCPLEWDILSVQHPEMKAMAIVCLNSFCLVLKQCGNKIS